MNLLRFCYILIAGSLIVLSSCKNTQEPAIDEGIRVKVEKSSGDDFSFIRDEQTQYYAPYPFNFAKLSVDAVNYDVMIISTRIEQGKSIVVTPLALLTLKEPDNSQTKVLIAVPNKQNMRICNATDYMSFMVEHFSLKQMVEYWYSNRYGLQGAQILDWQPARIDQFMN